MISDGFVRYLKKLADDAISSNPTPKYVSTPTVKLLEPDHIKKPPGPLPCDADVNPTYPTDRK